jgi:hypothetical protein
MTDYKRLPGNAVLRVSDNTTIPADLGNVDYQEFLRWKNKGNTEAPADPDPVFSPPPVLTPRERFEQRTGITLAQLKALLS